MEGQANRQKYSLTDGRTDRQTVIRTDRQLFVQTDKMTDIWKVR